MPSTRFCGPVAAVAAVAAVFPVAVVCSVEEAPRHQGSCPGKNKKIVLEMEGLLACGNSEKHCPILFTSPIRLQPHSSECNLKC